MKPIREDIIKALNLFLQAFFAWRGETIKGALSAKAAMVIAPHPDDETLACGGTIACLREAGVRVRIVIVTDGGAAGACGLLAPKEVTKIRQAEAQKAIRFLGVPETDIVFLSYPDGRAAEQIDRIEKDLAAQIWLCAPDILFAPYRIDGHADHRAVARAVESLKENGKITARILWYPVWFWPRGAMEHIKKPALFRTRRRMDIGAALEKKKAAFAVYRSQSDGERPVLGKTFLANFFRPYELFFEK